MPGCCSALLLARRSRSGSSSQLSAAAFLLGDMIIDTRLFRDVWLVQAWGRVATKGASSWRCSPMRRQRPVGARQSEAAARISGPVIEAWRRAVLDSLHPVGPAWAERMLDKAPKPILPSALLRESRMR
jgi:hypothetical protein